MGFDFLLSRMAVAVVVIRNERQESCFWMTARDDGGDDLILQPVSSPVVHTPLADPKLLGTNKNHQSNAESGATAAVFMGTCVPRRHSASPRTKHSDAVSVYLGM